MKLSVSYVETKIGKYLLTSRNAPLHRAKVTITGTEMNVKHAIGAVEDVRVQVNKTV